MGDAGQNLGLVEELFASYLADPHSVSPAWREFFADRDPPAPPAAPPVSPAPRVAAAAAPAAGAAPTDAESIVKQAGVAQLIRAYRVRGHLRADLDPLRHDPPRLPELELASYGLDAGDLDHRFVAWGLGGSREGLPLRRILEVLERTYCGPVGVEYMHIQDPRCRQWLQEHLEAPDSSEPLCADDQLRILDRLNAAEALETFLAKSYVGQKRFSLEGAETMIPMLDALLEAAAGARIEEAILGMSHRGRLNVLANVISKSCEQIFREFEGDIDPATTHGSGDVKYHIGATGVFEARGGGTLRVTLASNPSHLEAVDPVVEGMVRARQDRLGDRAHERVLAVLLHGDAAFSGQGVVAETLNLSGLHGYRTGGTVHIVIDNRIGFTTGPRDLRSSHYATDVARMVGAPILHVNGDHPGAAVRMARLALAYRQEFKTDVVLDLVCYRRFGHNEADDPSLTEPLLYDKIQRHRSVRKLYTERLLQRGDLDAATAERMLEEFQTRLRQVRDDVRRAVQGGPGPTVRPELEATEGTARSVPDTRVSRPTLERVLQGLARTPPGFELHPKLRPLVTQRTERFISGRIDWALGEALAFGSLVLEGHPVRLSGEDSARGTFSQRHAVLYDHRTARPWTALAELSPDQAAFQVFDSLLSEFAVLGFEYGYSVERPEALVLWEAQFGDFANGAQVIIDQFVASAEEKWRQASGLVLLLPHGFEGQGPEHSSARPERFLQLCARRNMRLAVPSTPAQYFHLLRAQIRDTARKPLIVLTPKSLLRHPPCVSRAEELCDGRFELVLDDPRAPDAAGVERVVLGAGKVFWELEARRETGDAALALCRVELLYPFPVDSILALLARYPRARDVVWVQEEPSNMGAWHHVRDRLADNLGPDRRLRYIGRPRAASPAVGSHRRHVAEQETLLAEALAAAVGDPGRAAR